MAKETCSKQWYRYIWSRPFTIHVDGGLASAPIISWHMFSSRNFNELWNRHTCWPHRKDNTTIAGPIKRSNYMTVFLAKARRGQPPTPACRQQLPADLHFDYVSPSRCWFQSLHLPFAETVRAFRQPAVIFNKTPSSHFRALPAWARFNISDSFGISSTSRSRNEM